MLLWLNGLPGINLQPVKNPLDILIETYSKQPINIEKFLDEDEFIIQLKNLNPKLLDFVYKERKQICMELIRIIVQTCDVVDDHNYKEFITYPIIVLEVMLLDVPPIMNAFFDESLSNELFDSLFSLVYRHDEIPEPQFSNFVKFLQPLLDRNISRVCQFVFAAHDNKRQPLLQCLNHIYSTQIVNFMITMFNPESSNRLMEQENIQKVKLQILMFCIEGLQSMKGTEALNFMMLTHEIMTRYVISDKSSKVLNYLISGPVISQLFQILQKNQCMYTTKTAAHILSLISNYYSYSMQNITIIDKDDIQEPVLVDSMDFHQELTTQFEKSDFFQAFFDNLHIFTELLQKLHKGQLGVISFKIVEIADNLIRISNLSLWKQLNKVELIKQIFETYFTFKTSNIIHTIVEKLVLYILNRAVSDFHPFWASYLLVEARIFHSLKAHKNDPLLQGPTSQLINHFLWFQNECQEKLNGKAQPRYHSVISSIVQSMLTNPEWNILTKPIPDFKEQTISTFSINAFSEESSFHDPNVVEKDKSQLFEKTKTNFVEGNSLQTRGDDPLVDDEDGEAEQELSENILFNNTRTVEEVNIKQEDDHQNQNLNGSSLAVHSPEQKQSKIAPQTCSNEESPQSLTSQSNVDSSPEDQDIRMSSSCEFRPRRRSSAMESSLKLKQIGEDYQDEFTISQELFDRVVLQPSNNKVIRVDEIDMDRMLYSDTNRASLNSSSILNDSMVSSSRKMKIIFRLGNKDVSRSQHLQITNNGIYDLDMSSMSINSLSSMEGKRFRKIQDKDKRFLEFIQSIKLSQ